MYSIDVEFAKLHHQAQLRLWQLPVVAVDGGVAAAIVAVVVIVAVAAVVALDGGVAVVVTVAIVAVVAVVAIAIV